MILIINDNNKKKKRKARTRAVRVVDNDNGVPSRQTNLPRSLFVGFSYLLIFFIRFSPLRSHSVNVEALEMKTGEKIFLPQ